MAAAAATSVSTGTGVTNSFELNTEALKEPIQRGWLRNRKKNSPLWETDLPPSNEALTEFRQVERNHLLIDALPRRCLDRKALQKAPVLAMAQARTCRWPRKCTKVASEPLNRRLARV